MSQQTFTDKLIDGCSYAFAASAMLFALAWLLIPLVLCAGFTYLMIRVAQSIGV